jgi:hypothetical protein
MVMVATLTLWVPILASAVLVFVASSIIHMVLPYHKSDYKGLPKEDEVREALRAFAIPPGDYFVPHCSSMEEMKSAAFVEKMKAGPVAHLTFLPAAPPSMAKNLIQWFVFVLFVSFFASYIAGRALGPGAPYLAVFRFAGAAAFSAYSIGLVQGSIWYGRKWSTTWKSAFDGLVYACLTAAVFGWLWPG